MSAFLPPFLSGPCHAKIIQGNKTASFGKKDKLWCLTYCRAIKDYVIFIPFPHSSLLVISVFLIKTLFTEFLQISFSCIFTGKSLSDAKRQLPRWHWTAQADHPLLEYNQSKALPFSGHRRLVIAWCSCSSTSNFFIFLLDRTFVLRVSLLQCSPSNSEVRNA